MLTFVAGWLSCSCFTALCVIARDALRRYRAKEAAAREDARAFIAAEAVRRGRRVYDDEPPAYMVHGG